MKASEHALHVHELAAAALEALANDQRAEAIRLLGSVEFSARAAAAAIQREALDHVRQTAEEVCAPLTHDQVTNYGLKLRGSPPTAS